MARFFVVGCWNNDNCPIYDPTREEGVIGSNDGRDYRTAVFESIRDRHRRRPFDFGILAGDNVYPRPDPVSVPGSSTSASAPGSSTKGKGKGKIEKHYYRRTLEYGLGLYDQLKIPYHLAFGNHDVVKNAVFHYQKNYVGETYPTYPTRPHPGQYTVEVVPGRLRLVVVDTNLLQPVLMDPVRSHYQMKRGSPREGWTRLRAFLASVPPSYPGWTLFVGHEPLVTVKIKDSMEKVGSLMYYQEFLNAMGQYPRAIYMCADLHAFELATFEWEAGAHRLPMIVVGTGGANPDVPPVAGSTYPLYHKRAPVHTEGGADVWGTMKLWNTQPAFGYVEGKLAAKTLQFDFRPLEYCTRNQRGVSFVFDADARGQVSLKSVDQSPLLPYRPEKCLAPLTRPDLCETSQNPRLDGGGVYRRREHILYTRPLRRVKNPQRPSSYNAQHPLVNKNKTNQTKPKQKEPKQKRTKKNDTGGNPSQTESRLEGTHLRRSPLKRI